MAHLAVLRRTLEAAQIRLHPKPDRIKELYRKELMVSDVQRLLGDIQAAVTVPEQVRKLEQKRVRGQRKLKHKHLNYYYSIT